MRQDVIYGIHPVAEAVQSRGRAVEYVAVARDRHDAKVQQIVDQCRKLGVSVRFLSRDELAHMTNSAPHQGVAAIVSGKEYADFDDVIANKRGTHSLIMVLDGVEDPHNLGAIIRTADGAGVDGIIIPERRAVGVTGTVAKAAAGATEHLPIARVTNIGRAIEDLKSRNIWTVGLDERGTQPYDAIDYNMDCAIVLGAEGAGIHDQVRKKCDFVASIPMLGKVPSLNVSVAAAIVMYEAARQRRVKSAASPKLAEVSR
jgi:23S rRNA (guanosine2251-2'-O)-methyltransferase